MAENKTSEERMASADKAAKEASSQIPNEKLDDVSGGTDVNQLWGDWFIVDEGPSSSTGRGSTLADKTKKR